MGFKVPQSLNIPTSVVSKQSILFLLETIFAQCTDVGMGRDNMFCMAGDVFCIVGDVFYMAGFKY